MTGIQPIPAYRLPSKDGLPSNVATWRVDPARAAVLVHDMQRYFLTPFEPNFREELVSNCSRVKRQFTKAGAPVFYTAQPGDMSVQERGLLRDFWGPGMRVDPADREITPELAPTDRDHVMTKWRYSAFFRSDLLARLREQKRDQLVVCGVYAHVGILATAIEAFTHDIQTFLVADALGDFSAEHHQFTLEYASSRCAVVTTTDEVLP